MKTVAAIVLVLAALVASEPPRYRGWQAQQQAYSPPPKPAPSYGPPPQEPTTESQADETTELPQFARITSKQGKASSTLKQSYFVVLPQNSVVVSQPQSQNLVYAAVADVQKNSPLVALPRGSIVAAAPFSSPARLELQSLPVTAYKTVYQPLPASYVETPAAGFLVSA